MRGRKPEPGRTTEAESALAGGAVPPAVGLAEPEWGAVAAGEWGAAQAQAASERWAALKAEMERLGTLGPENATQLEAAAILYARWRLAEAQVARIGPVIKAANGIPMPNPYLGVANQALDRLMRLEAELGLTPSMRARVTKVNAKKQTLAGAARSVL